MSGSRLAGDETAVSKEGMAAVAFGLTVLMIGITGGLLMQTGDDLDDGGPLLSASTEPIDSSNGSDGQWIRVKHETGTTVAVSNLTVNVTVPDHRKKATVHGLPTDSIRQSDYDGNHLFTIGPGGVDGAARANETDGRWAAGESLSLRIEERRVDLQPGETVEITVRHTGEDRELYSETVSAV